MTIKRQSSQQGEASELVSKHELRNVFRSAGAKHRRESRQNSCAKPQATFSITCHLCNFVFEQPVSRSSALLTCPSCGVRFEFSVENHADSIQVSQIEQELKRLRSEIEAKIPNRKENNAKSVIGPLPMQTVRKNAGSVEQMEDGQENIGFYSMVDRVRSRLVHLENEQWNDFLQWRKSLKNRRIIPFPSSVSDREEPHPERDFPKIDRPVADSKKSVGCRSLPHWKQEHKIRKRVRYALAGILFGVICCFMLILLGPKQPNDRQTASAPERTNTLETDGSSAVAIPDDAKNLETPMLKPLEMPLFDLPKTDMSEEIATLPVAEPIAETEAERLAANTRQEEMNAPSERNMFPAQEEHLQASTDRQLEQTQTQLDEVTRQYEQTRRNNEQLERMARQNEAESLLWEAFALSEKAPVRSMVLSLQAIERFQELGLDVPGNAKWTLNQSLATQNLGISLNGFQGGVNAMTSSRDGRWLLFAGDDGIVWLWDIARYDQVSGSFPLDTIADGVRQLLVTSNVNWGICVRQNGSLRIWNLRLAKPAEEPIEVADSRCRFTDAVVSEDGRWLAAYGKTDADRRDGVNEVFLWDLHHLVQNKEMPAPIILKGHEKPIRSLVISRNSKWLVSGSEDRTVRVYDLKTAYPAAEQIVLKGHELAVNCVCVSPDGRWLVTGGRDSILRIWDMQNRQSMAAPVQLQEHEGWISSLAFSPDGRFLASGSYDNTIRLWRMNGTSRPEVIHVLAGHVTPIKSVEFSRQGNRLVSLDLDHEVRLWDLSQGNPSENALKFRSPQVPFSSAMLTGDDRWMIMTQEKPNAASHVGLRLWPLQFHEAFDCAAGFAAARFPAIYQRRQNEVIPLPGYQEERIARNESQARTGSQFPVTNGDLPHETHLPEMLPSSPPSTPSSIELHFPARQEPAIQR